MAADSTDDTTLVISLAGPVNNIFVVRQFGPTPIPLLNRQASFKRQTLPLPPPLEKYDNEESVSKIVVSMPTNPSGTYYSHLMIEKDANELQVIFFRHLLSFTIAFSVYMSLNVFTTLSVSSNKLFSSQIQKFQSILSHYFI